MVYSDTSNKNGLLQDAEFWTNLGDAGISGNSTLKSYITTRLNRAYHKVVSIILESAGWQEYDDPNHGDRGFVKEYNLTANQEYVTIPVSDKVLKIRRVEVTYDGSNYHKAEPVQRGQISDEVATNNDINDVFSTSAPYYAYEGNYLYLFPVPTSSVTNGVKIWVVREIDEFVVGDTTQEPGFAELFHDYLSRSAALDWLVVNKPKSDTIAELRNALADMEVRMRRYFHDVVDDGKLGLKGALGVSEYS